MYFVLNLLVVLYWPGFLTGWAVGRYRFFYAARKTMTAIKVERTARIARIVFFKLLFQLAIFSLGSYTTLYYLLYVGGNAFGGLAICVFSGFLSSTIDLAAIAVIKREPRC